MMTTSGCKPGNDNRRLLVVLLLWLTCLACGPVAPASISTSAPSGTAPDLSDLAGVYACTGHEFGLLAAAGGLTLSPSGVATFRDYYGPVQTGTWALGRSANELLFRDFDLVSASYDVTNKMLQVALKPNSKITHTEDHRMECSLATPPGTATAVTRAPQATPTLVGARTSWSAGAP